MRLAEARALQDDIKASGLHCVVPRGFGPDGYFAKIVGFVDGHTRAIQFNSPEEWEDYCVKYRQRLDAAQKTLTRPRSPLDAMIDKACGVTEEQYR